MTEFMTWLHSDPGKWMMTGAALLAIGAVALIADIIIDHFKNRGK